MNRRLAILAILATVSGVVAWMLQAADWQRAAAPNRALSLPSPDACQATSEGRSLEGSNARWSAMPVEMAQTDLPTPTVVDEAAMESLTRKLGPTAGLLGPEDREQVRHTIRTLSAAAEAELSAFRQSGRGGQDPRGAWKEADLMATASLWKAVEESLENGNYWLGSTFPTALPKTPAGTFLQALTVTSNGAQAAAVFIISRGRDASEFRSIDEYRSNQHLFWLQEAARRFNERPDAERKRLYEALEAKKARKGYDQLGADLQAIFPLENRVVVPGYLMFAPNQE